MASIFKTNQRYLAQWYSSILKKCSSTIHPTTQNTLLLQAAQVLLPCDRYALTYWIECPDNYRGRSKAPRSTSIAARLLLDHYSGSPHTQVDQYEQEVRAANDPRMFVYVATPAATAVAVLNGECSKGTFAVLL